MEGRRGGRAAHGPRKSPYYLVLVAGAFALAGLLPPGASPLLLADTQRSERWLQGPNFRRQLQAEVGVVWKSNPLRNALRNLSESQGVAMLLDRRVDPEVPVDFSIQQVTLDTLLRRLAKQQQLGVSLIDSVVYLGPPATSEKLATLAALRRQEAAELPPALKARLLKRDSLAWPDLATPREILQQLADEVDLKISNLNRVPHDLWPLTSIPPLPWSDRFTLVLAGFHATFRVRAEQGQIELMPIPPRVSYQALASPRPVSASLMEKLAQQYPNCKLQNTARGLQVQGSYDDFEQIERLLRGEKVTRELPAGGEKRYSLKIINQPVGGVVQALAQRLDLTLEWDPAISAEKQRELVSFEVRDATLRQLLEAALAPAALDFRLQGRRLQVSPKP